MNSEETYKKIAEALGPLGVKAGQMFGMATLTLNGKAIAGIFNGDMVFKLEGKELANALTLNGAKLFDPMGGRPMKQWVQLGAEHEDQWQYYTEAACKNLLK